MNGTTHYGSNASVFILMLVLNLVTGLSYASVIEHSMKAFITALIWLVFKILADYIAAREKPLKKKE